MNGVLSLFVLASAIWMGVDASQLAYDKRDIRGLGAMGPTGWFLCGLFFWIFAFPFYLTKRAELKAAGERRRAMLRAGIPPSLPLPPGSPLAPMGHGAPPWGPPPPPFGVLPTNHAYGPPVPPPAAPSLTTDQVADQIVKLGELRVSGLITEAEFAEQKARLLARLQ